MEEIIIKEREIKEKLVELINSSGLPAFMLKSMIKDLYDQLNALEQQQYDIALENKKKKEKEAEKKCKK